MVSIKFFEGFESKKESEEKKFFEMSQLEQSLPLDP